MGAEKYYIPGFDGEQFLKNVNTALFPFLGSYKNTSLAQRANLCFITSMCANAILKIDPEDTMDVIRFNNSEMIKPATREFIRKHHPAGVQDSFCGACGQTLP